MPALGSSVINKSGKKLAPKAPVRRPAPAPLPEPSTRNSVEPPLNSPTPHAQTVQTPVTSPGSVPPQDSIAQKTTQAVNSNALPEDSSNVQEPPNHDAIQGDDRTPHNIRKRKLPATPLDVPGQNQAPVTVTTDPSAEVSKEPSIVPQETPPSTTTGTSQPCVATSPGLEVQSPGHLAVQETSLETPKDDIPAAKRRKVTSNQTKASLRHRPDTTGDANEPSSSTDIVANTSTSAVPTAFANKASPSAAKAVKKPSTRQKATPLRRSSTARVVSIDASSSKRPAEDAQSAAKVTKSRKVTGKKTKPPLRDAALEIVAIAERTTNRKQGRRSRKDREPTPEEAENETIAPGQVKMADLCRDTRKGKKSDMLKALQERDKEELLKKQQQQLQELVGNEAPEEDGERNAAANASVGDPTADGAAARESERRQELSRQVPGTYVNEDGEIMIDTDSLQVDRHAQAAAEREQGQIEAVEENYLSRPAVNSWTYTKREKQNSWSEELTDDFYEALRMFGTDFDMIGRMLRKTRRAIKLKFTREERLDPDRINQTLLGERLAVDVGDFARRAGEELKETAEHDRMMEEDRRKIEEVAADELRAKEEEDQVRKDQAQQEGAAIPDDSSGKENREIGKKKEKRKNRKKDNRDAAQKEGTDDGGKRKRLTSKQKEKGKSKPRKGKHKEGTTTEQIP
ncbi:MAG: hypothetical protein Q9168_001736, partial [Polycauliona sp. 1 TL-2023]